MSFGGLSRENSRLPPWLVPVELPEKDLSGTQSDYAETTS